MKKKNNNTPPSSYRLPKETLEKINEIKKATGMSGAEVIASSVSYYAYVYRYPHPPIDKCNTPDTM